MFPKIFKFTQSQHIQCISPLYSYIGVKISIKQYQNTQTPNSPHVQYEIHSITSSKSCNILKHTIYRFSSPNLDAFSQKMQILENFSLITGQPNTSLLKQLSIAYHQPPFYYNFVPDCQSESNKETNFLSEDVEEEGALMMSRRSGVELSPSCFDNSVWYLDI